MAQDSYLILCGDIGGTNSRLRLFRVQASDRLSECVRSVKPPGKLVCQSEYKNDEFDCFEDVARKFLNQDRCSSTMDETPVTACFAVAGPVDSNSVAFTNRSAWTISGQELQNRLKIREVRLINDFVANGYGLLTLNGDEVEVLQDAPVRTDCPIACVGAGTGLGECYLTPAEGFYTAFPSEGGHCEFAPRTEEEVRLLVFLKKKFGETSRVSVERVVSGVGLANVYDFLRQDGESKQHVDPKVDKEITSAGEKDQGAVVAKYAEKGDRVCSHAVDIMLGAYGCEVGAASLKWLPFGGMFIAGGIAPKNLERIKSSGHFMEAFRDKGRVSKVLEGVKVMVVKSEDIGQRGAHLMAFKMFQDLMDDEEEADKKRSGKGRAAKGGVLASSTATTVVAAAAFATFGIALWAALKHAR